MSDIDGEYRILLGRLKKTLSLYGVRVVQGGENEPLPDQAYKLLTLLDALTLWRRMQIAADVSLDIGTRQGVIADSFGIVSPVEDIHLEATCERVTEALALMSADLERFGEDSPQGVIVTLLSAVGFLLTTLGMDDPDGEPYMDGDELRMIPNMETVVRQARDRVQAALECLDEVLAGR